MSDWIDRQQAINALYRVDEYNGRSVEAIRNLPSAQPEIIRCRECKHWCEGIAYSYCQKLFNCGVLDVYDYMRDEDDYCSLAERREE